MPIFDSVKELKIILGENIIGGHEVTHVGGSGLDITWVKGAIYDATNDIMVNVAAGSATLTDDDTNYLKWKSGAILVVELTTATGNEVLIAEIDTSSGDIDAITEEGFDFDAVTDLDGRPLILLGGDGYPNINKTYGQIIIEDENLINAIPKFYYRTEEYRNLVKVNYDSLGAHILKNIIAQMDSIFRANNKLQTRTYRYEMRGSWNTNYKSGLVRLFVDCKKDMVLL